MANIRKNMGQQTVPKNMYALFFRPLLCLVLLPFLFFTLQPHRALAQSFDCRKAVSPVEKMICQSDGLKQLDEGLAKWYKKGTAGRGGTV